MGWGKKPKVDKDKRRLTPKLGRAVAGRINMFKGGAGVIVLREYMYNLWKGRDSDLTILLRLVCHVDFPTCNSTLMRKTKASKIRRLQEVPIAKRAMQISV